MKKRSAPLLPQRLRPPMRHIWRHQTRDLPDLVFQVVEFARAGDRVNLLRLDRRRFTLVENGSLFLIRDADDRPIGSFRTVGECIAAGDAHLDTVEEARAQHEADFGPHDPKGAA